MLPGVPGEQCRPVGHPNASLHSSRSIRRQFPSCWPVRPSHNEVSKHVIYDWSSQGFPAAFVRDIERARATRAPGAASDASAVKVGTAIEIWWGTGPIQCAWMQEVMLRAGWQAVFGEELVVSWRQGGCEEAEFACHVDRAAVPLDDLGAAVAEDKADGDQSSVARGCRARLDAH